MLAFPLLAGTALALTVGRDPVAPAQTFAPASAVSEDTEQEGYTCDEMLTGLIADIERSTDQIMTGHEIWKLRYDVRAARAKAGLPDCPADFIG